MSELPKIETFEGDITNEIKTKEANIRDIAVSNGSIENKEESKGPNKNLILISIAALLILISTVIVIIYLISQDKKEVVPQKVVQKTNTSFREQDLSSKLPFLYAKVGRFITKSEANPYGYVLDLDSYGEVFSFTLKNESTFSKELSDLLKVDITVGTSSPALTFTDTTINNQNMRIMVGPNGNLVYSFLNTKYLLLSTSTEGILSMRSAIIK